jgi:hypothetical protein
MDCEGFLILLHRSLWLDHGFIFSLAYGWITDLFSLMREKTLKLKIFSEYSKRKKKKKKRFKWSDEGNNRWSIF